MRLLHMLIQSNSLSQAQKMELYYRNWWRSFSDLPTSKIYESSIGWRRFRLHGLGVIYLVRREQLLERHLERLLVKMSSGIPTWSWKMGQSGGFVFVRFCVFYVVHWFFEAHLCIAILICSTNDTRVLTFWTLCELSFIMSIDLPYV